MQYGDHRSYRGSHRARLHRAGRVDRPTFERYAAFRRLVTADATADERRLMKGLVGLDVVSAVLRVISPYGLALAVLSGGALGSLVGYGVASLAGVGLTTAAGVGWNRLATIRDEKQAFRLDDHVSKLSSRVRDREGDGLGARIVNRLGIVRSAVGTNVPTLISSWSLTAATLVAVAIAAPWMLPVVGGLLCGVNRCSRWAQKRNSSLSEMVNRSSEDRIERLLQSLSRVAGYERGNFGGDGGLRADLHRSSALHVVAQRTLDLFRARATFAAAVLATGLVGSVLLFSGAVGLVGLVGTVYMAGRCADAISMVPSAEMALGEAVDADAKQRQLLAIPPEEEGDVDLDPMIERGVMFDGVEFGYAPTQSVLRGVTFKLDAGTRVAVVGRSGSGKSTLGKLVTGELFPTYGDVRLDHVPTTRIDPAARQRVVAGVPQTPRFIAGRTIMQMLLPQSYWQPTDRQRALELCNRAGLAELLAKRGIDRGVLNPESFSGGEAKRLATVRALLRNPDVLVLDELMSSLDVETRRDITDLIDQARTNSGERPAVLDITHDLDSIGPSDHVVMLDRGVVVDEGTYRGLIQNGGPFADFAGIRSPWLGRSVPTTGSGYGNVPGLGLGVTWSDVGAGASTGSR